MSVSKSIPFLGKQECPQHPLNPLGVDHYSPGGGGSHSLYLKARPGRARVRMETSPDFRDQIYLWMLRTFLFQFGPSPPPQMINGQPLKDENNTSSITCGSEGVIVLHSVMSLYKGHRSKVFLFSKKKWK